MVAKIIVDVSSNQVNHFFDYFVSEDFSHYLKKGMRVIVSFKNRLVLGYVINITDEIKSDLKGIESILDLEPVLTEELIDLALYIASTNFSLIISAIWAVLPNALKVKYTKELQILDIDKVDAIFLTLYQKSKIISSEDFTKYYTKIQKGISNKTINIENKIISKTKILKERFVILNQYSKQKNARQQEIVDYIRNNPTPFKTLIDQGFSRSSLNSLIKNEVISIVSEDKYREIKHIFKTEDKTIILTADQLDAKEKILHSKLPVLLHGVTNSGKTEVYMQVISECLNMGKSALVLVPEVSLTHQVISRFKKRFSDLVGVMHSGINNNEQYDEWRKIKNGDVKIVIGTRKAIFTPFTNLGIIIIDEAHDSSYIQEENPKYNVIDIAIYRKKKNNCLLVFGSATPNVIDYYKAKHNLYTLIQMPNRIVDNYPSMKLINMSNELENNNTTMFSYAMQEALKKCIINNNQAIILINKRGHSSFVMCRECGSVVKCPNCDISLTYHLEVNNLECHYCGFKEKFIKKCKVCGSVSIRQMGYGTEKVLEQITKLLPNTKVARMDSDNTKTKNASEKILENFNQGKIDILVGTQMISKGLDFPKVTFVGILMADMILKLPDYRNAERTFQLINQVSGRAGRDNLESLVIIQSYNTKHYSIQLAIKNDYQSFYQEELRVRKLAGYPPFVNITKLTLIYLNEKENYQFASEIIDLLKKDKRLIILGPTKAEIYKVNDRYCLQIFIKFANNIDISNLLNNIFSEYQNSGLYLDVLKM